jgi:hypothetical protein
MVEAAEPDVRRPTAFRKTRALEQKHPIACASCSQIIVRRRLRGQDAISIAGNELDEVASCFSIIVGAVQTVALTWPLVTECGEDFAFDRVQMHWSHGGVSIARSGSNATGGRPGQLRLDSFSIRFLVGGHAMSQFVTTISDLPERQWWSGAERDQPLVAVALAA